MIKFPKISRDGYEVIGLLIMAVVLPCVAIYASGSEEETGRAVALCFLAFASSVLFPYFIIRHSGGVGAGGPLAHKPRQRRVLVWIVRVFAVLLAVGSFWYVTIPVWRGTTAMIFGESPKRITGVVKETSKRELPWLQRIQIREHKTEYELLYVLQRPFRSGEFVELSVLPHSNLILSAKRIPPPSEELPSFNGSTRSTRKGSEGIGGTSPHSPNDKTEK